MYLACTENDLTCPSHWCNYLLPVKVVAPLEGKREFDFNPTNGLAVMLCSSGEGVESSDWNPFFQAFCPFPWPAGFSQEKPGQVFSGEVALGRIGAWRGVDRFCLEKFELIGPGLHCFGVLHIHQ